jgi:hypothetical protein
MFERPQPPAELGPPGREIQMALSKQTVLASLEGVHSPDGTPLPNNKAAFIEGGTGTATYTAEETPYSSTSVNDGNWHQIVAVYQASGSRLIYVDGAPAEDARRTGDVAA